MKSLILLVALVFSFSAHAQHTIPPGTIPGHDQIPPRPPDWPDDGGYGPGNGGHSCAPEVLEGNVAATTRTLGALSRTPSFASATEFRSSLARVSAMKSDTARMQAYLALIGIDSRDSRAVADFVGARDVRGIWLTTLEKNASLTPSQADTVATQLRDALRGSLQ